MILPHNDQFLVVNPDLYWPENEQGDIILGLCALAQKKKACFVGYRETVTLLGKIERSSGNHNRQLQIPPKISINHKQSLPISTYQLISLFLCIHIHNTTSFASFRFPACLLPVITVTVLTKASAPRSVTALVWRLLRKTSTSALNWRWVRMTANVDHPALALVAPATVPDHHHRHHL
ncbi:uncharacterized protein LOC131876612 [Cryptomeria japonica]|uniref:uncharacterized protein LOC131876612 n=1 Tax=Cryptomeria japonica TaxID=3369 RepID=UPI0027D9F945|nr:uncharacterized protein LOC131876612 [Cryptomeria japonica]